ncbi:MAG TPA: hypothetical protein PKC14_01780 [Candidatus Absconditabacterales bacterium]|nr:hypothetical protein [Candidatus Absconditabacterales bacterium]
MNYELFDHPEKKIFLVDMRNEKSQIFSEITEKSLRKSIDQKKKIAIIVNKKSYATGIICQKCGTIPQCDNCSVPIAFHKLDSQEFIGLCHICKKQYNQPSNCPDCQSTQLQHYGIGIEKVSELLQKDYKIKPLMIESETVNSLKKIKNIEESFNQNLIFVGTSLLNHPFAKYFFDLVIYLNADLGLNIPDFSSQENNFQFLYEGLSKHSSRHFIVQTSKPDNPSIRFACKLNPDGFFETENIFRKEHNYPPYHEICLLLYKNEIEEKLFSQVNKLYQELLYLKEKSDNPTIEITATPPLIYKIFGKYRYSIIIKGKNIRSFVDEAFIKLQINKRHFKVDRNAKHMI